MSNAEEPFAGIVQAKEVGTIQHQRVLNDGDVLHRQCRNVGDRK